MARSMRAHSRRIAAIPRVDFDGTRALNAAWRLAHDVSRQALEPAPRTMMAASGAVRGTFDYRIPRQSPQGHTVSTAWV
jgi:hypothetical protein